MTISDWIKVILGDVTSECVERAGNDTALLNRPVYGVDRETGLNLSPKYTSNNLNRYKLIEPGMFAYNPMRLNIGSIGYCAHKFTPGLVSPDYIVFKCKDEMLDPDFMSYYIKSRSWSDQTTGAGVGSVRMRIYYRELRNFSIYLPCLKEQRLIAEVLGALDDKIELNRRMNATLEEMARAVFKSWFIDFEPFWKSGMQMSSIGDIPTGWEESMLGEMCEKPQYGYTASAQEDCIGPKFLRITDINKTSWIEWSNVPHCKISENEYPKYQLRPGDLLIARMADPGHGVLIEEEINAVFASYLIRFRPKDPHFVRYLQFWQKSNSYWDIINSWKTGTTRPSLNAQDLCKLPVVKPPVAITKQFGEIVEPLRNKIVSNTRENTTLSSLRDALLPRLMRGEVHVQEVYDNL